MPFIVPYRHKALLWQLVQREFQARFRGAVLGPLWPVLSPLAMLLVYTFVFERVLALRWPGAAGGGGHAYALNLLVGLIAFNMLADVLARAPRLILENPGYVKKVVFPLDLLPWVATAGAAVNALIGLVLLILLTLALHGQLHPTLAFVPLLGLPLLLWCVAIAYVFAALGVFLRDIGQLSGPLTMVLLFLSPVFYAAEQIPDPWRGWLLYNPLAATIQWWRQAIHIGTVPAVGEVALHLLIAVALLALAHRLFRRLRPGFADVM